MISASNSHAHAVLSSRILAPFFLFALLCAPPRGLARSPQSPGVSPAQQPAVPVPGKKDSATTSADPAFSKTNPPKPRRVFTNDDLSPSSGVPIAPGARRRLKQLNRCDHTCFLEVEKQALGYGYSDDYPRSRKAMEDRLAGYIEELQHDPKWQRLLLEMISAHIDDCLLRQKTPPPDTSPPHIPTRAEILEEEERARQPRRAPISNYLAADSAVRSYIYRVSPNRFKYALMFHEYLDEDHRACPVVQSTLDSTDDEDP